jgi:dihydropteroate synthase
MYFYCCTPLQQKYNTKYMLTLNCKGKLLLLDKPIIMGIINATHNSFYKGNLSLGFNGIVDMAGQMLADGATIVDIGGQSTKPGAAVIPVTEEIDTVVPLIEAIKKQFEYAIISIDTFNSATAKAAINAGAGMVNDVSAGNLDAQMIETVAAMRNVPYVCMHMRGEPATMQTQTHYENLHYEILQYFVQKVHACRTVGIHDVIIDIGFGFAKTTEQNFSLLKQLHIFKMLDCPILTGISRKSMIYKTLNTTADNALNGTTALHMLALNNSSNILRVHDVREAKECVDLYLAYSKD